MALAHDAIPKRRGELTLDSILSGMASGPKGWFGGYHQQTQDERAIARLTQQKIEIVTHEALDVVQAEWLATRIARNGTVTPNQRALLTGLKAESPTIHPALQALIDKASILAA